MDIALFVAGTVFGLALGEVIRVVLIPTVVRRWATSHRAQARRVRARAQHR